MTSKLSLPPAGRSTLLAKNGGTIMTGFGGCACPRFAGLGEYISRKRHDELRQ
ncbi:MAG: hypothetical protein M1503_13030 [Thaumarchaeota archaeon]|nr:hypothetical protein [Nitrososphaerota archaeon]MCL5319162.1 hypothetical protein [Nitrososphaerota archaeon]